MWNGTEDRCWTKVKIMSPNKRRICFSFFLFLKDENREDKWQTRRAEHQPLRITRMDFAAMDAIAAQECVQTHSPDWCIWQRSRQGPTEKTSKRNHLNVSWCGTLDTLPPPSTNITDSLKKNKKKESNKKQNKTKQNHPYPSLPDGSSVTFVPIPQTKKEQKSSHVLNSRLLSPCHIFFFFF